ncbi:MAG: efflux RND transporter periplasmic adaptor subunit [Muribaculaceae bacterium]|nr:efflux RND transporter periplasmic adaptor subunit [Muribaculaceae bacterium]
MKYIRLTLITFAVAAMMTACGQKDKTNATATTGQDAQKAAPVVSVITAQAEDVDITNTFTTNIEAYATNNIVSQTAGRIASINVEVGQKVSKGQLLAKMDDVNLAKTRMQYINDSTELARLTELYNIGAVAQADYDMAKLSLNMTKKTYYNLAENTYLRSPINGVVTARNYDRGDMYSMTQPIFVVQQIQPVKMLINMSESLFPKVNTGMEFDIDVDSYPGETFKGKVNLIYPTISSTTHTFPVEVVSENKDLRLRPGMFARVTANFGTNHHVVIPDVAVVKQQGSGEHFVYVLQPDNTVKYTLVELGKRLGNRYEIVSGLNEGDRIVTEGQVRLKDGVSVTMK